MSKINELNICYECGGTLEMKSKSGRIFTITKGLDIVLPSDFKILTCNDCNEDFMDETAENKAHTLIESLLLKYNNRNLLNRLVVEKDWENVSCYKYLTEKFIEKHSDKLDWYAISCYKYLTEEFIEKHSDKLDWHCISIDQKLSEEFIEKHSDKVNWYNISKYQKLSEEFIEKYSKKVNWKYISKYQKLSEESIEKHKDKFSLNYLSHNIIFDENEEYNICNKCNCLGYYLNDMNCNEAIMDRVLK